MGALALVVLSVVVADGGGGGGGASEPWESANETSGISCDDDLDESAIALPLVELEPFAQTETDPGGTWWLRFEGLTYIDAHEMTLVALDREGQWSVGWGEDGAYVEMFLHADVRESPTRAGELYSEQYTVMSLAAPDDAVPGEALELRRGDDVVAVLGIRQNARPAPTYESLSITLVDQVPQVCDARCTDDALSIPRLPVLQIDYQGDPAALDLGLTLMCSGGYQTPVFIDVFAISRTEAPILVVDRRDFGVQGDCTLSHAYTVLYDPDARTELTRVDYDEVGPLEPAPVVLYEEGTPVEREQCGFFAGTIWDPETRTRDFGLPCACVRASHRAPPLAAVVVVATGVLARRRRRA